MRWESLSFLVGKIMIMFMIVIFFHIFIGYAWIWIIRFN